ncbi:MAG: DUF2867 domain-containing protein, partial [Halomonas sp.]
LATRAAGYFALTPVWRLRASVDRLLGGADAGPRQHAGDFTEGETFDFWRVHRVRSSEQLILLSRLRAPGEGGMEITVEPGPTGGSRIALVLHWHPAGVWGLLYWFMLWPAHAVVLRAFLRGLAQASTQERGPPIRCS